jgi:hypothetical protein
LKELARSYLTISQDLVRVMIRVKALYRSWAIPCSGKQVYGVRHRSLWLDKIGEAGVRRRAQFYYQQLDALRSLRQQVRRDLLIESARHQAFSGIAPVTESSGKRKWVHFRWACPKFLRQSFHEWAGHSIVQSEWARVYYQRQRSKGNTHHAAVRALAFKWIRIVFRCWQDGVAYDENTYLAALAKHGSPLSTVVTPGKGL